MRAWTREIVLAASGVALLVLPAVITFARASGATSGMATADDGDDLIIGPQDFRLHAIDAFEMAQTCKDDKGVDHPCGREAAAALRALVQGKTTTCAPIGDTDGDRVIALCSVGSMDIGTEMVRQGWALVRPDYAKGRTKAMCAIETEAARAHRGAWQYKFELPYFFKGGTKKTRAEVSCGNA